jgi:hypothetical protein
VALGDTPDGFAIYIGHLIWKPETFNHIREHLY